MLVENECMIIFEVNKSWIYSDSKLYSKDYHQRQKAQNYVEDVDPVFYRKLMQSLHCRLLHYVIITVNLFIALVSLSYVAYDMLHIRYRSQVQSSR